MISAADVTRFNRDGWLKLAGLFSTEELQTISRTVTHAQSSHGSDLAGLDESGGARTEVFAHQRSARRRQMFENQSDLRLVFPELAPIVKRLAGVARELLRQREVRILQDQTFIKPASSAGARETPWHQDLPYIPVDRRGLMTFWIPVQKVTVEAGALRFVSGSHRLGPLGRLDLTGKEYNLEDLLTEDDRALIGGEPVSVPLAAGEFTVHDGLTLHGAGANVTGEPRKAWTVIFMPAETRWSGAPFPHARMSGLNLKPFGTFDHPSFNV